MDVVIDTILKALGIIAGSSVLSAIILAFAERGKKRADAAETITNAAKQILEEQGSMVEDIRKSLTETQEKLETEKARSDDLEEKLHSLQREIAELKEERKFKAIFQAVSDPILIIEVEGRKILDANDAAIVEYGYSRDELRAMTYEQLARPKDSDFLMRRRPFVENQCHTRKDTSSLHVSVYAAYFNEALQRMAILVLHVLPEREKEIGNCV